MKLSELFTDESKWVQRMFSGYRVSPTAKPVSISGIKRRALEGGLPAPNCFCLDEGVRQVIPWEDSSGAIYTHRQALQEKIRLAIQKLFPERLGIVWFNDHPRTTFADVQAVIREVESAQ